MKDNGITIETAIAAGAGVYLAYKGLQGLKWLVNNLTPDAVSDILFLSDTRAFRNTDTERFDSLVISRLPRPVTIFTPLPVWLTSVEKWRVVERILSESWLTTQAESPNHSSLELSSSVSCQKLLPPGDKE